MRLFLYFLCFLVFFPQFNWAQSNSLPFWDYRSISPIQSEIGIRYYFDNQNNGLSGFLRVDYSLVKELTANYFLNNRANFYDKSTDLRIGFSCEVRRNFEIYAVNPKKIRKDENSWSFIAAVNLNGEVLLRPVNKDYYEASTEDIKGTILGFEYSLINTTNTGLFKYLGNTNGRFALKVRHLTDKWGAKLFLQNDFWVLFKQHIRNHDHGNTTEFGFSGYYRYKTQAIENTNLSYYNRRKLSANYSFQIITDRKIANNTSSTFARLGYYSVRKDSIFHGYSRFQLSFTDKNIRIGIGRLVDDLYSGRNLQRWAHQGTNHRNLKNRKNIGGISKQTIYISDFSFTKDNNRSRKLFLLQSYYNKMFLSKLPDIESIKKLDKSAVNEIYSKNPDIKTAFKNQLFVNKYRYKKTRVQEPTALFPWEGQKIYFEKNRKSVIFDAQLIKNH